jgi:lipoprotein-releasing system permease protein
VEGASGSATQSKTEKESLDFRLQPDEVAVGSELALTLGVVEGDEINVVAPESLLMPTGELPVFERVKVRAVIRTNIPENDATLVVFDSARGLKRLRDSAGVERGLEVRLNNPFEAESLLHKLTGLGVGGVQTWSDRNKALFYSLGMEKRLMTFFLILTVIIASFSVVTVLFLLVTEKRPDVGALRAMGATQAQVRSIFTFVGLALGSLGICLGGVLGLGLSWWAKTHQIIELPDYYYDRTIPVRIELLTVLVILGGCLVLAWLGSMIPAARVARLDPVKALRRN